MIQVYGEQGLNQPAEATDAAEIVAEERRDAQSYLLYAQYAALAGDDRQAELAGRQAVSQAPAAQREQVERQVDAIIRAAEDLRSGGQAPQSGEAVRRSRCRAALGERPNTGARRVAGAT